MVKAQEMRAKGAHPNSETDLERLLERVATGDACALAELYDRTSALVFGLATRILRDSTGAQDVTIEVYTQVWEHAAEYEHRRGAPLAWLLTLARNRAVDLLRKRRRERATEALESGSGVPCERPGPEDFAAAGERQRQVLQALGRLDARQREAIELAYFSGLSHTEIAARLDQPVGTVKTRIRSGMIQLREYLGHWRQT